MSNQTEMQQQSDPAPDAPPARGLTRRAALALGGVTAGGLLAASPAASAAQPTGQRRQRGRLPAKELQELLGLEGSVSDGILSIGVGRKDIGKVKGPRGVEFSSAFEIDGELNFQPLPQTRAFLNGDFALKSSELNPVVDALLANGLVFQAMHQHFTDMDPMVWYIHFRGEGDAKALARATRKVLEVTATPLPQKAPSDPKTPLDHARLARILHGTSEIGEDGVVTVSVARRGRIAIGDVVAEPGAGVATSVTFKPLDEKGTRVAVVPDFGMTAGEVGPVCRIMRAQGFEIGCLYNQETAERPQLFFSHMIAVGAPDDLAVKIRKGLDRNRAV